MIKCNGDCVKHVLIRDKYHRFMRSESTVKYNCGGFNEIRWMKVHYFCITITHLDDSINNFLQRGFY